MVDIVVILLLITANGLLSLSEMALVSARTARLKEMVAGSDRKALGAVRVLTLKEHPGRFLSTIQIGITLIGIGSGAFGGTQVSGPIAHLLQGVPLLAPYAEEISIAFVVLSITFLTLLMGELVPKNLALSAPESIAARVARPMQIVQFALTPGVWILDTVSRGVLAVFGRSGAGTATVTEEEIKHFLAEGAQSGAIEEGELDIIYKVIKLGDKTAEDLMTPRVKMTALDIDASDDENLRRMREAEITRFPVYRGDPANIVGVLGVKDLIDDLPGPITDIFKKLHQPVFVSDKTPSNKLLRILLATDLRMAFVVDEYGTVKGLVTLSDITRPVIGAPVQGLAAGSAGLMKRRDGSLLVDGLRPADDLKEPLKLSQLPREREETFHTVAGLVIANLHELPKEGDSFDFSGWRFEVIDMDGQRIDKVLISPIAAAGVRAQETAA